MKAKIMIQGENIELEGTPEEILEFKRLATGNNTTHQTAIKKKFGETLKSKNRVAQENELLCKFIAYNLTVVIHEMFELGIRGEFIK